MKKETILRIVATVLLAAIIFTTMTVGTDYTTDPETYSATLRSLDEKKSTVMALSASSAIASAAIAAIPGDASTPIANKIADLSSSLLLILCAIYLEKALITLTGYASCGFLIPAALGIFIFCLWKKNSRLKNLAVRFLIFGLVIMLVIPVGVKIGDIVYATYDASIQESISLMNNSAEDIEEEAVEEETQKAEEPSQKEKEEKTDETKAGSGLKGWLSTLKDKAGEVKDKAGEVMENIGNAVSNVGASVGDITTKAKLLLNNFIDAIAMLIITSCLIPVAIIMFFMWLTKTVFSVDIAPKEAYTGIGTAKKAAAGRIVGAGSAAGKKLLTKTTKGKAKLPESK